MPSSLSVDLVPYLDEISRNAFAILADMQPLTIGQGSPITSVIESWVYIGHEANVQNQLLVQADMVFARNFAQRTFGITFTEEITVEVIDAIQELANTVGGNLKGLVSEECVLSIPETYVGSRPSPQGALLATLNYDFDAEGRCTITLLG